MVEVLEYKRCSGCMQRKPLTAFHKRVASPDGMTGRCAECLKTYSLEYRNREGNPEKYNERARQWRKNNPEQVAKTNKRNALRINYGLTMEQFTFMLQEQNYCCAVCGIQFNPESKGETPHVDHNHDTKAVRALLCGHCNSALGHVHESVDTLKALIAYLGRFQ